VSGIENSAQAFIYARSAVRDSALPTRRRSMMTRRTAILGALAIAAMFAGGPAAAAAKRSRVMQALDPDNDGTVDLDEAKKAASTVFDKLDRDHEGTLDRRELRGRMRAKQLDAADPDKDGTLTKDEYLKEVEKRFKAADPDNDGTLDDKELRSRAGQSLLRLLQ
jgi:Ca2+-binding EF-hand superfamily protein